MMIRMHTYLLIASAALGLSRAAAQTSSASLPANSAQCNNLVGQVISSLPIESIVAQLSSQTQPRGEFETTAQYESRLRSAGAGAPHTQFVSVPLDKQYVTYNADAGQFEVQSHAVDNRNASWDVFAQQGAGPWKQPIGSRGYIDLVLKFDEIVTGRYPASNAYGATVTVNKIARTTMGVLERAGQGSEDLFFPDRPWDANRSEIVARIPVSASIAPQWRANLRAAALIAPMSPFVVRGTKDWGPARFDRPREVTESLTAVVADIRCVTLTDEKNRVVAAMPTR